MIQTHTSSSRFYGGMRIIVADRSLHIRSVLRAMLGGLGVTKIVDADNMAVALEKFEFNKFDVLIVDERLPPDGAIELLKNIQKIGSVDADFAPIMMTTRTTVKRITAARGVGVEEILTKPFSVADLDARIKRCIAVHREISAKQAALVSPPETPGTTRTDKPETRPEAPAEPETTHEVVYI